MTSLSLPQFLVIFAIAGLVALGVGLAIYFLRRLDKSGEPKNS